MNVNNCQNDEKIKNRKNVGFIPNKHGLHLTPSKQLSPKLYSKLIFLFARYINEELFSLNIEK